MYGPVFKSQKRVKRVKSWVYEYSKINIVMTEGGRLFYYTMCPPLCYSSVRVYQFDETSSVVV